MSFLQVFKDPVSRFGNDLNVHQCWVRPKKHTVNSYFESATHTGLQDGNLAINPWRKLPCDSNRVKRGEGAAEVFEKLFRKKKSQHFCLEILTLLVSILQVLYSAKLS